MIPIKSTKESDAKSEAIQISLDNPNQYVVITSTFGLFASLQKRLHVFAPSDSVFDWYVLNGEIKQFTKKQFIADQNATPGMN